jgi:oligoribonuclease
MAKKDKSMLLWVDLEMTGLSPVHDRIMEVAAIITGWDLEEVATYTGVVKVSDKIIAERMVGEFWEKNKASYDGLVAQNASGKSAAMIERELLAFVKEHCGDATVYLAGNSIHQDQKFIEREWPELNERLHYRQLDVSAWKVYFENALGKKFLKPENHRALDDIRGSIEELKWYLKSLS